MEWAEKVSTFLATLPPARRAKGTVTKAEKKRAERVRYRRKKSAQRLTDVAILDFETDPFDKTRPDDRIVPFAACLFWDDGFEIIWEENEDIFVEKVIALVLKLPRKFTVFAHNGGRFDYMFLMYKLRGAVKFKGRGLMLANIGPHEIRDSFHIIPDALKEWSKEKIDYEKMRKHRRNAHRQEIINYMVSDCRNLMTIVREFLDQFGLKISIGAAALGELKKVYAVKNVSRATDTYLRQFYFGGRVECMAGAGEFIGEYKMYDVNSMYPFVMSTFRHPIGGNYEQRLGAPSRDTVFIDINCRNRGALVMRDSAGGITTETSEGNFFTTIWEYNIARQFNLIDRISINFVVDCAEFSDFRDFVLPIYNKREKAKQALKELEQRGLKNSAAYMVAKKDSLFLKLLANNCYGKFAQDPSRYKDSYLTDSGERPADETFGTLPVFDNGRYAIWEKPAPGKFYRNVGTAASITGAARAVLLEAIMYADDPLYCDTDSIICRNLTGVNVHPTALGAWDIEKQFSAVRITGKKMYAGLNGEGDCSSAQIKVRSKGVSGLRWVDYATLLVPDAEIVCRSDAPTITRTGKQFYLERSVKRTAPFGARLIVTEGKKNAKLATLGI
jgi:Vibrio phage DNA polymerase